MGIKMFKIKRQLNYMDMQKDGMMKHKRNLENQLPMTF